VGGGGGGGAGGVMGGRRGGVRPDVPARAHAGREAPRRVPGGGAAPRAPRREDGEDDLGGDGGQGARFFRFRRREGARAGGRQPVHLSGADHEVRQDAPRGDGARRVPDAGDGGADAPVGGGRTGAGEPGLG